MDKYPLQRQFLVWGFWVALISGALSFSLLLGFMIWVLFICLGALWRREHMPILAFCLAYQWFFVATGYIYQMITGTFPGSPIPKNPEGAIFLSLIGFLALVAGIRAGLCLLRRRLVTGEDKLQTAPPTYNVRRLFWYVIVLYAINWFVEIFPRAIFFNVGELIYAIFAFRDVILCLLFLVIVRQRKGYRYGIVAFLYVLIPQSISTHAKFMDVFALLFVILLSQWRPWLKSVSERRHNFRIAGLATGLTVLFLGLALIWQGGIKHIWRPAVISGEVTGGPTEKLSALGATTERVLSGIDWKEAWESLAERLSGATLFSYVLENVPQVVPHEKGALTRRAIMHILKPRFIFPEKSGLGSSSWLVWKYAGLMVAGEEQQTSIGIGYMAEFYIDFGVVGMLIALFLWGLIVGVVYARMFVLSSLQYLSAAAVTALFFQPLSSYEGEIAYLLGGLLQRFIVFVALLYFLGPWLHRKLLMRNESS